MKHYDLHLALILLGGIAYAASAGSFDWPQWQGPDRNAISKETGLLQEWPKEGPPLAWRIKGLGSGYSAPSIAAGRLFGMSNRGDDEVVWALSEKDGKELWVTRLGPALTTGMPQGKEGAGCTPTVDGDHLYVLGRGGDLSCLQVGDGKIIWHRNLVTDLGGQIPTWKFNESPLIDGDKLICTPGGEEALLVALDKWTGKIIWKSKMSNSSDGGGRAEGATGRERGGRSDRGAARQPSGLIANRDRAERQEARGAPAERPQRFGRGRGGFGRGGFANSQAAYASAIAIDFEGQRQYVQLTAKALVGVAASDGKFLWRYDKPANRMGVNCSTPIYHDGRVFAASAYGAGGGLVKLSKDGNGGVKAEEVWSSRDMENHHGGVVLVDGCLYGANGGNGGGYLVCLDFQTGKVLWNERDPDKRRVRKGSVVVADGRIYYRTEEGTMLLIEPNRKEYIERGRFEQPDRTRQLAWTHPVIANGKLYVRDQEALFCYDEKAQSR
jgi:outer membrane protein assembly factor BamB